MVNAVNPLGVNPTAAWQLVTRSALVMASWLSLMETYDDNSITVGYTRWIACAHEYWFHVQSEGNRTTHTIFTLMGNECAHLVKVRRERCLRWSANQIDTRWLLVDKLNAFVHVLSAFSAKSSSDARKIFRARRIPSATVYQYGLIYFIWELFDSSCCER